MVIQVRLWITGAFPITQRNDKIDWENEIRRQ